MAQTIPPALEEEIKKFDSLRRNHETLLSMIQSMQSELVEVKNTIEELKKQSDDTVTYKSVGSLMFNVEKSKIQEELDDRQKTLEMYLASRTKQAQELGEKLKEIQTKIQTELGKQNLRLQ